MDIRKYIKSKDYSYSNIYMQWNFTTACCFKYKTNCEICPNQIVCEKFKKENAIHPVKYATMVTYRNIGPKGLDRFVFIEDKRKEIEMVQGYDSYLLRQADEYWTPCEPETDKDGEYTKCENCFEQCDAYKEIIGEL